MKRKSIVVLLAAIVAVSSVFVMLPQKAYADEFKDVKYSTAIKCSGKRWYLPVYVKMGSRTKNAKSITVKSSNEKVVWPSADAAKEKAVVFEPQKKGKAIITIKVKYKNGSKKTYKIGVGVKTKPPKVK